MKKDRTEWSADRVRDVLLWTGGLLLVLAVVSFVAVLWTRDDNGKPFWTAGRVALLLFVLMVVTAWLAVRLRPRLPATAEVVGVLTLALAATEWYAVRRAGFAGSIDTALWWSLGAALGTALELGAGRLGLRGPRILAPILGQVALVCAFALLDGASAFAVAYAVGSALSVVVAGRLSDVGGFRASVRTLVVGAAWFEFVAFGAAVGALAEPDKNSLLERVIAVAAVGLAPAAARWSFVRALERRRVLGHTLVGGSALAIQGAILTAIDPSSAGMFWAAAAVVGGLACAFAILVLEPLRRGVAVAGVILFGLAAAIASATVAIALLLPLTWLGQPWGLEVSAEAAKNLVAGESTTTSSVGRWAVVVFVVGPAVGVILTSRRAIVAAVVPARLQPWVLPISLIWCATAVPGLLPQYTGVTVLAAWAVALLVALAMMAISAWCDRSRPTYAVPILAASALPYASSVGWSFTSRVLTVAGFVATASVATWSAWRASRVVMRSLLAAVALTSALAAVGAAALAIGWGVGAAGFAIVAGATVAVVSLAARGGRAVVGYVLEATAVGAMAIGTAMSTDSWSWLASAFSLATVGFGLAATRDGRRIYGWGALGCGASAVLTWFAAVGVGAHVEGFVLTVMSGIVLVVASFRRGGTAATTVEWLAILGLTTGSLVAADDVSPAWLAGSLTIAFGAIIVAAIVPAGWLGYPYLAAATAAGAMSAWLATADVRTPEAYTATWAAGAIGAGWLLRRSRPNTSSWVAYAPGILTGLGPTTWMAIQNDDLARTMVALAGGLASMTVGAARRLQAPLLIGAAALAVIGLDAIAPTAADLPRWIPLTLVGLVLVWFGATAERRLAQARQLRELLGQFG